MISLLQLWDGVASHHESDAAFRIRIPESLLPLWAGIMIDSQKKGGFRIGSVQGLAYSLLGWGNEGALQSGCI